MGFFDYLLPGAAAVSGILNGRADKRSQTTTASMPVESPGAASLREQILKQTQDSLTADPNLAGYQANQESNINRQSNIQRQKIEENAALHGVTGPALDASINANDDRRFSDITQLKQNTPLQAISLRQSTLQNANNILSTQPRSTTTTTNATGDSNKLGGAFDGLLTTIARLHGRGAFGKQPTVNTGPASPQIWP